MIRLVMLIAMGTVATASSQAADAPSPYAPLAFLAGHCWQGTLPGARKDTDTHCFNWVYGEQFVRDVHTVHGDGHKDYVGETIYFWDSTAKQLRYLYIESDGGSNIGAVESEDGMLVFPETTHSENGKTQTYRSRWRSSGSDAYDAVVEFKKDDAWTTAWSTHMNKVPQRGANVPETAPAQKSASNGAHLR
jgi:hypothetical protein